jgi:hypothetical protein
MHPSPDTPTKQPDPPPTPLKTFLNHLNIAILSIFAITIVSSGGLLFMLLVTDWIKLPPDETDHWIEINSQILNAVFTVLALTSHPFRLRMLATLLKARPRDARKITAYTLLNVNVNSHIP